MKNISIVLIAFFFYSCNGQPKNDASVVVHPNDIISEGYLGNGFEWDPYQLDYGHGRMEISEADKQKIYSRLDFMQPKLIRVMTNTTSLMRDGKLAPETNFDDIAWILNYCQSRGVTVLFGDWGGRITNIRENTINENLIAAAAQYVDFLINQKGYSCIKYYNMINEPNGTWSSTQGNFSIWARAMKAFYAEVEKLNLTSKLSMIGPDAAIWTDEEAWWIDSCAVQLDYAIGLYDIHTYPTKIIVNSEKYSEIIGAYKSRVPAGKKIVMAEIGFKYGWDCEEDSLMYEENIRRIKTKKYASLEDSQMFVYDHIYGIDMADALFQTANVGYSGSVVWMLDDAMHTRGGRDKLKVWGFWNILGDEFFGAEEEIVRPWYYAWSLLTRSMPDGSTILRTEVSGDALVKSIAVKKDNNRMISVLNVSKEAKRVHLQCDEIKNWNNVSKYVYAEGTLIKEGDHMVLPNESNLQLSLDKGITIDMPAQSLIIYTDF